jgi:cyclopropane fatty-acyl-phospholipid synthase-like methyltransferase
MSTNTNLINFLNSFDRDTECIYSSNNKEGYWSNLSKEQNSDLISMISKYSTNESIEKIKPLMYEVIFSDKRAAALELLQLTGEEMVVDLGCMWGALTIPLAKQSKYVLGIDQTIESLIFSEARAVEENLNNIKFLCGNLRDIHLPSTTFDAAIVNGVLEWIPEIDSVVVDEIWYQSKKRSSFGNPGVMQKEFLKNVHNGLIPGGKLFLAIENRYDYKMFCGIRDPHAGTLFTTIFPRFIANILSKLQKKREYRPWLYSFSEIKNLVLDVGFSNVELYACWPDYRFPEHINVYGEKNKYFSPASAYKPNGKIGFKKIIANRIEWILFKLFNFQFFAPSIIVIATK